MLSRQEVIFGHYLGLDYDTGLILNFLQAHADAYFNIHLSRMLTTTRI
jgi:hypothetical protein